MAGPIPQSFIDDLLERVDIVDIVAGRVELKKSGKNHSARCPFHEEKSPSFTVAQDKQFYYCFGCGAGGNALRFVMEFDRLDFIPALEILAKHAGVEIPRGVEENPEAKTKKDNLYSTLHASDRHYRQQLKRHPSAGQAVQYLKSRGLTGQVAARFGLGFAPPGWDHLLVAEGRDDQRRALLVESGMLVSKPEGGKLYDRFRHRIMFPIRDQRGRTVGFGGRVLDDSKPKYLNSPETPIFSKGRELYGLYEARQALKEIPRLIMVEGYMDVIALAQYGIHHSVATLGTALTESHLSKIFRYTAEIVFCFDGDMAGEKAASRALETILPAMRDGVSARFLFLPEAEDPDSIVRKLGMTEFLKRVEESQPLSEFFFAQLEQGIDTSTADGKAKLSTLCAPQINRLPEGVFRQLMLAELSTRTGLSTADLSHYVASHQTRNKGQYSNNEPNNASLEQQSFESYPPNWQDHQNSYAEPLPKIKKLRLSPIKYVTALLLNHPDLAQHVEDNPLLTNSENDEVKLFLRLLALLSKNPSYKPAQIFAHWLGSPDRRDEARHLQVLGSSEIYHPPLGTGRDDHAEFCDALEHVIVNEFELLPNQQKALHLLAQEKLNEREIKQLHKIHLQLSNEGPSTELKNAIKQRLVVNIAEPK